MSQIKPLLKQRALKSFYRFSGSAFTVCVPASSPCPISLLNPEHVSCYSPLPTHPDNVWSVWQTFLMASDSDTYNTEQLSMSLGVSHVSKHHDMVCVKLLTSLWRSDFKSVRAFSIHYIPAFHWLPEINDWINFGGSINIIHSL